MCVLQAKTPRLQLTQAWKVCKVAKAWIVIHFSKATTRGKVNIYGNKSFRNQESETMVLSEHTFRLLGRYDQFLLKHNLSKIQKRLYCFFTKLSFLFPVEKHCPITKQWPNWHEKSKNAWTGQVGVKNTQTCMTTGKSVVFSCRQYHPSGNQTQCSILKRVSFNAAASLLVSLIPQFLLFRGRNARNTARRLDEKRSSPISIQWRQQNITSRTDKCKNLSDVQSCECFQIAFELKSFQNRSIRGRKNVLRRFLLIAENHIFCNVLPADKRLENVPNHSHASWWRGPVESAWRTGGLLVNFTL